MTFVITFGNNRKVRVNNVPVGINPVKGITRSITFENMKTSESVRKYFKISSSKV